MVARLRECGPTVMTLVTLVLSLTKHHRLEFLQPPLQAVLGEVRLASNLVSGYPPAVAQGPITLVRQQAMEEGFQK